MTREDIAKSLKPIVWHDDSYKHNEVVLMGSFDRKYAIISGLLGRKMEVTICTVTTSKAYPRITYKNVTMDEAKMIARYWQVEEACRHFNLDEQ